MSSRKKTDIRARMSPSTWLILILVVVLVFISLFYSNSRKDNENQEIRIAKLEKQVKKLKKEEPKSLRVGAKLFPYQKLYPKMKVNLPPKWNAAEKTVYLTFDDGPTKVTKSILKQLKKSKVKVTFFVVGNGTNHSLLKQISKDGHAIGVHTYSHKYDEIYKSVTSYVKDFNKIYELIVEETGVKPTVYRYPGGSNNAYNVLNQGKSTAEMFRRGFVPFDWNYDSRDASDQTVPKKRIIRNAVKGIGANRVILLMHDSETKTTTAKALPTIINRYKKAGYKFGVLSNKVSPILFSTPNGERYD
jgi:peptidoglycan/xylan/chitin deacetylase (PgdA/CDA1 family)